MGPTGVEITVSDTCELFFGGLYVSKPWETDLDPLGTPLEPLLAASWAHLGTVLGPCWGHLGAILGHLAATLGPSWASCVPSWAILGPCWGHLGPCWAILGPFWGHLGPRWAILGTSWGLLALSFGLIFNILTQMGRVGDILLPCWTIGARSGPGGMRDAFQ